ncbi:MAG: hypothetical protein Q4F79_12575 [Eubacteriales bacterium]|nr:hypothetical protein [Eubacteriales bacterium]
MRGLQRNHNFTVWISDIVSYDGADAYGNTGQPVYGEPVAHQACVSPNDGTSDFHGFGKDFNYQQTINIFRDFAGNISYPTEYAKVWLEADPKTEQNDYVIRSIKKYINLAAVQLRRVNGNE